MPYSWKKHVAGVAILIGITVVVGIAVSALRGDEAAPEYGQINSWDPNKGRKNVHDVKYR